MSKQSAPPICKHPDHVTSYFSMQKGILAVITVSGLIYNLGLMAFLDKKQALYHLAFKPGTGHKSKIVNKTGHCDNS